MANCKQNKSKLKEDKIELNFLDHVAIRVNNLEESARWYSKVFGLKKTKFEKWGEFPIFMMSDKFSVALFPANLEDEFLNPDSNNIKIDHFAFNVNKKNFDKALRKYSEMGLEFEIQDHHYLDSVYTKDPNGHVVELTTLKVDENTFYNHHKTQ